MVGCQPGKRGYSGNIPWSGRCFSPVALSILEPVQDTWIISGSRLASQSEIGSSILQFFSCLSLEQLSPITYSSCQSYLSAQSGAMEYRDQSPTRESRGRLVSVHVWTRRQSMPNNPRRSSESHSLNFASVAADQESGRNLALITKRQKRLSSRFFAIFAVNFRSVSSGWKLFEASKVRAWARSLGQPQEQLAGRNLPPLRNRHPLVA